MFDFSPVQLIIVLVIALLVLGPKRLPDAAKSLGHGLREFKRSVSEERDDPPAARTADQPAEAAATVETPPQRD